MSFPPEDPNQPPGMDPSQGMGQPGVDPSAEETPEPQPLWDGYIGDGVSYMVPSFTGADGQDRRNRLGRRVIEEFNAWREYIDARRTNAQDWRRDYEGLESDGQLAFDGAAQCRSPLVAIAVQAHAQKLNLALTSGSGPTFRAKARKRASLAAAPVVEDVVDSYLEGCQWLKTVRQVHLGLGIDGINLVRVTWETETERVRKLKVDLDEETMATLAESGAGPGDAMRGAIKTDRKGRPKPQLVAEEQTVHDGCRLRYIPFKRSIMLPCTAEAPEDLWALGEMVRIRGIDLREGAASGKYIEEEVDELLKMFGDSKDSDDDANTDEIAGTERTDGRQANALFREYECIELCWHDDLEIDEDDSATARSPALEWHVLTVHVPSMRVLRVAYSHYEHARSYYVPFRYLVRDGELISASVAERANQLQQIATFLLNSIIDLISILKGQATSFAYDWTAGIKPGNLQYRPGMPWGPLKNLNGIKELPIGQKIPEAITACMNVLEIVKEWFDLLTGANDTIMGRVSPGSQTATEISSLFGQAQQIFEDYSQAVLLGWADVADLVRWNIRQFAPGGEVEYRVEAAPEQLLPDQNGQPQRFVYQSPRTDAGVLGPPQQVPLEGGMGFGLVPAEVLGADVDLIPAGLSQLPDRQQRLQRDIMLSTQAIQHPVIGQMQSVLVELFKAVLESGQAPNRERVLQLIDSELRRMQEMAMMQQAAEQLDAAGMMGQQQQGAAQAQQQGQMAQEAHQTSQAQANLGMQQQALALAAPGGGAPNGNGKK